MAMEEDRMLEEGKKPRFGPWIVVSKPSRKKKKVTVTGMGRYESGGKDTVDGQVVSSAVGLRFLMLDNERATAMGLLVYPVRKKGLLLREEC